MTQLRDARLREALDQAPDASMRPPARTRDAIHAAAHAALQPAWRRWWASSGQRTGWSAAFATVLLAGFVTLLWRGEDVPQVQAPPRPSVSQVPAPAPAPAPLPEVAAPPPPPAQSAPRPPRAERRAALQDAQQRQRRERAREESPAPLERPAEEPPSAAPAADRQEPLAKQQESRAAGTAAAPSAAAPSPRAAAAPGGGWTQVRIEADGVSKVVPRSHAERLPALLARALAAETESLRVTGPADLTIEIGQADQALGVLALHGEQWRWLPLRDARQARTLRIDPALSAALRQEAEQLLRR